MPDITDPTHEPASFGDLPIQPTGSGVADLEVAYEQMRLADEAEDSPIPSSEPSLTDDILATEDTQAAADSAAHPS